MDARDNALNLLRLLLAILVIASHSAPITGLTREPRIGDLTWGEIAVGGFFAISGYLITRSRFRTRFWPYLWRRGLRIMPGYLVCLVVTAFGAAYIAGLIRGGWSFAASERFVLSSAKLFGGTGDEVGTTLRGLPLSGSWNGSLWTIRWELLCYLLVGLLLLVAFTRTVKWIFPALFGATVLMSAVIHLLGARGTLAELALLLPFFLAGATLFAYQERVPCDWRWALVAAGLLAAALAGGVGGVLGALPLAYLLLWLGFSLPRWARRIGARNDYSYGAYLYAFPVQQLLVIFGAASLGLPTFFLLSVAATAPLAFLSWHVVERPAQRLKGVFSRRASAARAVVSPELERTE